MAYNAQRPITAANCPTRDALERKPGDRGFLMGSIGAKHSQAKTLRHRANVLDRAQRNAAVARRIVKTAKAKK